MLTRRVIIAGSIIIGVVCLGMIGILVSMLLKDSDTASNYSASATDNEFSGTVSELSGGAVSYRNLKGLTLRINQIDTCNPKVLSAYVSVSAESGDVNKSFAKKDIKVYLDGKQLSNFDFNTVASQKLPLANMITIDRSGSMAGAAMDNAKSAAVAYIDKLKPSDQAGVTQFDHIVETLADISTDKQVAKNSIIGIMPRGDTAMYDALSSSIDKVPDCGRKAVTLLTDGSDTASTQNSEQSVIEKASKVNLPLFAVGIKGAAFDATSIRTIAEKTGGQYLEANTPSEISGLYDKIDGQLKGQFVANLNISIPKDAKVHSLKIISNIEGSETGSERTFLY